MKKENTVRQSAKQKRSPAIAAAFLFASSFIALIAIAALISPSFSASAETIDELQRKIQERNANIEKLNQEIATFSALADKTSQQALTLQNTIKGLEANGKVLDLDIKRLREKIAETNLDIKKLDLNIGESEQKIASLQEGIGASVRQIQRSEGTTLIENFLSQRSLTDFLSEIDNQFTFNNALQSRIAAIQSEKQKLETNKSDQVDKKNDLVKMQTELSDKKKVIDYNKSEQSKILKETKNQEQNFQKLVKDKQALKASFEKEVFDYESQLKYTLDPSSIPQAGSQALSWPLDKIIITQKFGKTVGAERLYVSGSHNGVDFGAKIGTRVLAMGNGTVLGTGDTDLTCKGASFGRWVFIRYDNGLSAIFGHLSVISAKEGQRVRTGDVVGYSGNTGYSTGPHLHVSMYPSDAVSVQNRPSASCGGRIYRMPIAPVDAYLDPLQYLPKI